MNDRLIKPEEVAKLIPEIIETEQTHLCLLWDERLKIAEAILNKCIIITKENRR